jgi:hypothetical protein
MSAVVGTEVPIFEVRYAVTAEETRAALRVEAEVFQEKHYLPVGTLYEKFLPQSAICGAFALTGECLGMIRMVESSPLLPPMLMSEHHMQITIHPDRWLDLAGHHHVEEVGTIAVPSCYRGSTVALNLLRFGLRHAYGLNGESRSETDSIAYVGAILTPQVAWGLRLGYHFPLQQVGPEQHYMEGTEYREDEVTAPYFLDLDRFRDMMLTQHSDYGHWFFYGSMRDLQPPPLPRIRRDDPELVGCAYEGR